MSPYGQGDTAKTYAAAADLFAQRGALASAKARFWKKVSVAPADACWLWLSTKDGAGYGSFHFIDRQIGAHRLSYMLRHGEIPEGLHLDHLCRTRACVNPDHLEAVTQRENNLRGVGAPARHAQKTHCPIDHPLVDPNLNRSEKLKGHRKCRACDWARSHVKVQAAKGIAVDFKAYADECYQRIITTGPKRRLW